MRFHVITLLPKTIEEYANSSILGRAQKSKKISVKTYDLRKWGMGKYKKVDDRPFGGGPGMVMAVKPIYDAVSRIQNTVYRIPKRKTRVILFSTRGKLFTQKEAKRLAKYDDLILICGRYEGVDERVAKHIADEELSIGEYVLTGGEMPALAAIDAVSRLTPGVLGKNESLEDIKGSYPVYTRPEKFDRWCVPKPILPGHHKNIDKWRRVE